MQFSVRSVLSVVLAGLTVLALSGVAWAEDLIIHLPADASLKQKTVRYQCDAQASKLGVPSKPFAVEYINGAGNSLVVVPVAGNPLIFSNVTSGSGARYTAQRLTWWEAHGAVTLSSDSPDKLSSACRPVQGN